MIASNAGLSTDQASWLLYGCVVVIWLLSSKLALRWHRDHWSSLLTSLFGLAWIGFGIDFIFRFLILSYDSVTFGNTTDRLMIRPVSIVNTTVLFSGIFWLFLSLGFAVGVRRKTAGPFKVVSRVSRDLVVRTAPVTTAGAIVCLYLSAGPFGVPLFLLTPLAIVGSLWAFVAAAVWGSTFQRAHLSLRDHAMRVMTLVPGLLHAYWSPYRERLVAIVLVPLIAALFAGRRYRTPVIVLAMAAFFFVSTLVITAHRRVMWGDESVADVVGDMNMDFWTENPIQAPWTQIIWRFHGFDSLLLTVDLVPDVFPFSGRTVFTDWVMEAFVPRALYSGKVRNRRGPEFAETIWSFDGGIRNQSAIAPSMPGDLYEAGGVSFLAFGALLWGLALGVLEGSKRHLPLSVAAGVTCVFAMTALGGVERDFVFVMASTTQLWLVLTVVTWFLVPPPRKVIVDATPAHGENTGLLLAPKENPGRHMRPTS